MTNLIYYAFFIILLLNFNISAQNMNNQDQKRNEYIDLFKKKINDNNDKRIEYDNHLQALNKKLKEDGLNVDNYVKTCLGIYFCKEIKNYFSRQSSVTSSAVSFIGSVKRIEDIDKNNIDNIYDFDINSIQNYDKNDEKNKSIKNDFDARYSEADKNNIKNNFDGLNKDTIWNEADDNTKKICNDYINLQKDCVCTLFEIQSSTFYKRLEKEMKTVYPDCKLYEKNIIAEFALIIVIIMSFVSFISFVYRKFYDNKKVRNNTSKKSMEIEAARS